MCSYLPGEDTKDVYTCPRRNWTSTWKRFIMVYQLDKPKPKAQEILWTRNRGWKEESSNTHFSSESSLGVYSLQLQKEGGLDEPLSWISTVSHSHTFKWGDMELLLLLQIGRDSLLSTKGKEISLLQVGMLFQSKGDKHCSLHFPCVPTLKVCPFNTTLLSRVNKHLKSL